MPPVGLAKGLSQLSWAKVRVQFLREEQGLDSHRHGALMVASRPGLERSWSRCLPPQAHKELREILTCVRETVRRGGKMKSGRPAAGEMGQIIL